MKLKKIDEVKYLTVENSERYRIIMKCMFNFFNEMKYWLYEEEILEYIKNNYCDFEEYTIELLKNDLNSLLEWKNLIADTDTKNVKSIMEFKNREFKYQISKPSVEIEKMLLILENLQVESESHLNSNFMINFTNLLLKYRTFDGHNSKEIYEWWNELKQNFKILSSNYTNFISQFSSEKIDTILKIEEFLIFKEKFLKYLTDFIKEIQLNYSDIEYFLKNKIIKEQELILNVVYEYEMSIPGIQKSNKNEYLQINLERLKAMSNWFIGHGGKPPLIKTLFENTNAIINKIIKYAIKIYEDRSISYRRDAYLNIISKFEKCKSLNEAHVLSAHIFGIEGTTHIKSIATRETENTNSSSYEEKPTKFILTEGRRGAANKVIKSSFKMNTEEKLKKIKERLEKEKVEKIRIEELTKNNSIQLKELPILTRDERKLILKYICRKEILSKNKVLLKCEDGTLELPDFKIEVK